MPTIVPLVYLALQDSLPSGLVMVAVLVLVMVASAELEDDEVWFIAIPSTSPLGHVTSGPLLHDGTCG